MPSTLPPTQDLDRLYRRFQGLQLRFAGLQGQARELQGQRTRLTTSVSLAKARLELAPQAAEVFTYLQDKAHRRAVGEFEDLLSAFVEDVIPEAGAIRLELGTERGSPSLDILLDNGGDLENILEGNGGGLTNVVVVGLGFSALSRTRNRQLMVLDEPDCWLKALNVPAFTKVIAEVANPREDAGKLLPGCQTLMVSHNDISLMDEGAHIQDLRTERDLAKFADRIGVDVVQVGTPGPCAYVVWVDNGLHGKPSIEVRYRDDGLGDEEQNALTKGYPYLESIGGARPWVDDTQPGVRWVEVSNLRRHLHTRMALSSGLNVMTGGVNGGKSTLYFTAFRAMAYGDSDDTMIRHGANEMTIRLGLENGVVLELVRKRRGGPKVLFRRYDRGTLVNEGRQENRGGVPAFVTEVLGIERVDELDIQLRHQKEPVFLLNETASRRAQLLSVGRESGLLQELIERQRQQVRRDREDVKREEVELNHVNRTLTVLAPLAGMAALVDIMASLHEEAMNLGATAAQTHELVCRLAPLEAKVKLLALAQDGLTAIPGAPTLADVTPLAHVLARLSTTVNAAKLPALPSPPPTPNLQDCRDLEQVLAAMTRSQAAAQLPDMPCAPVPPGLTELGPIGSLLERLERGPAVSRLLANLPRPPQAPILMDTRNMSMLEASLNSRNTALSSAEKENLAAGADAKAAQADLHNFQHELGVCPVCAKPFDETTT